jgi:hypothetical protein
MREWDWIETKTNDKLNTTNMRGTALHYESTGKYDVIDFIQDYKLGFNKGNVIKYITRATKKGTELQDLYKAKDYIDREIQYVKELQEQKDIEFTG